METFWTSCYYGISHAVVNRHQCTVEDRGGLVTAMVFPATGTAGFWTNTRESIFTSVADARAWCERIAEGW